MNAPFCPISHDQQPKPPQGLPTKLPSIPLAYDLPSLIRAVNIMRDILRTLTTSLTVNNTYSGTVRPSQKYGSKEYLMSHYRADWYQVGRDEESGFVYYKAKGKVPDKEQRAYITRMHGVELRNVNIDGDTSFFWRYHLKLDGEEGDGEASRSRRTSSNVWSTCTGRPLSRWNFSTGRSRWATSSSMDRNWPARSCCRSGSGCPRN